MSTTIEAYVSTIEGYRAGHLSEKMRVCAAYESANIMGSLTFDVPIAEARNFYIGQRLTVVVQWEGIQWPG